MMKHFSLPAAIFLVCVGLGLPGRTSAEERSFDFLHALQDNGYSDVAVDYLRGLQAEPDKIPEKLREVWDLEKCKTLLSASKQTFHAQEAEQLTTEAEQSLAKFLREKPNHREAAAAQIYWGQVLQERGLQHLRVAQTTGDKALKAKEQEAARKGLTDARKPFNDAAKVIDARLSTMPKITLSKTSSREERAAAADRDRMEMDWIDAVFQVALTDYYTGLTYLDPKAPERQTVFHRAIKRFDYIWQTHRVTAAMEVNPVGLFAHMWHGRIVDEMGDKQTALDIYDEVLANVPDNPNQQTGMEPLFAQVEHFRFLILRRNAANQFIDEAATWLNNPSNRRRFKNTDGYQGVSLELAKILLEEPDKAGGDRNKNMATAMGLLKDMVRVRSQHQQEAILLMRKHSGESAADVSQIATFDEAVAVGDSSFTARQWNQAAAAYQRALELIDKTGGKDAKQRIAAVRDQWAMAKLGQADDLVNQDKLDAALEIAKKLSADYAQTNRENSVGPRAAAAAVQIALGIYANATPDQKAAKLAQLQQLASRTIELWPQRSEADDARLALGQAQQFKGNAEEAMKVFLSVNPNSERYAVGLFMAGRLNWQRYLVDKRDKAQAKRAEEQRAVAVKQIEQALELMTKAKKGDKKAADKHLPDVQLLMAEVHLDSGKSEAAVKLLEPLVKEIQASKPDRLDNTMLRIFISAVRAYVALGNTAAADEVGTVLLTLGPDVPPVNGALVEFARSVEQEVKKADGDAIKLTADKKADEAQKAQAWAESLKKILGKLVQKLAQRKELGIGGMVYVADTCLYLGLDEQADRQYEAVKARFKADPELEKTNARAKTRVLSQSVTLKRRRGDSLRDKNNHDAARKAYEDARGDAQTLIDEHPNSLEPRMEKARIVQRLAEEDPQKYEDAVGEWVMLWKMLQAMRKKPPEFYEATFNLATCLAKQGEMLGNADAAQKSEGEKRLKEAQKVLKSTLVISPQLNGPDTVAKYEALLKDISEKLPPVPEKPAAPEKKPDSQ